MLRDPRHKIIKITSVEIHTSNDMKTIEAHQKLQWKYGTVIFTKSQPNKDFIKYVSQSNKQSLLLTTHPFEESPEINSLWLESCQSKKSLESVEKITEFFVSHNATRNSHLIIKGGGLLMDLGGFAASIYMRGIKKVTLIPTTLLGMVDATIGGKTAINFSNTKNLLGSIRNPDTVIIYPGYLSTQTEREFYNGMVETIKMAITFDEDFFRMLENVDFKTLRDPQNAELLQKIIKRSLMIKLTVVQKDLNERKQRKWLNFGHTIGHAIELDPSNKFLHGECVAIGMVKALEISLELGIIDQSQLNIQDRLKILLKKLNLPTEVPRQVDLDRMVQKMMNDKKKSDSNDDQVEFVLIKSIGTPFLFPTKVPIQKLRSLLGNAVDVAYPHDGYITPINDKFPFPFSKSISLRYLFISCLAIYHSKTPQTIKLTNFLSSQDTEKMIGCLKELGFQIKLKPRLKIIEILGFNQTKESGELDVGNSGITARFILPLCFMIKGKWKINCQKRMEQRPNAEIFQLCKEQFEGNIEFMNKPYSFPAEITSTGNRLSNQPLIVQGKQSSQFISSAMINWSFLDQQQQIRLKPSQSSISNEQGIVSQSYLHMTNNCLQKFGIKSILDKRQRKITIDSRNIELPDNIQIQNDLSTYSYPYIFYELHGFDNPQIEAQKYMQGDILFYEYVEMMKRRMRVGEKIVRFDFNNCTDTFMTFMVYCCSDDILNSETLERVVIENISNQRVKESNRIDLTIRNLKKIGICVEEYQNRIEMLIKPLPQFLVVPESRIVFETHEDHRLAMSFAILATMLSKKYPDVRFIIDSKKAVQKTFPQFWTFLEKSKVKLNYLSAQQIPKNIAPETVQYKQTHMKINLNEDILKKSLFLIGNRGSGKTTIGSNLVNKMKLSYLDLDHLITEEINESFKEPNIERMVQKYGWDQFRDLESKVLQKTMSTIRYNSSTPFVICTGGGILQSQLNRALFSRQRANIFYIQRPFSQLKAFPSSNRPTLSDFENISKQRQPVYEHFANQILTFPQWLAPEKEADFALNSIQKYLGQQKPLNEGYIMCIGDEILSFQESLTDEEREQVATFEIRVDKLLSQGLNLRQIREVISNWRLKYPNKQYILTLRTKQQLGEYDGETNRPYEEMMHQISKIPTDFLDYEITKSPTFVYNYNKFIHSYHGNQQSIVQKLINQKHGFKKFCFMKPWGLESTKNICSSLYEKYNHRFQDGICVDLSNPLTRFKTKYQMAVPQKTFQMSSATNLFTSNQRTTGIMTLSQMKHLKKLFKL